MSGGHFDHPQWHIHEAAEDIERLIATNDDKTPNEWGDPKGRGYPPAIIAKFREAAHTLHQAAEMLQRVDWLVSDDDGPETFMERWESEVRPYYEATCAERAPVTPIAPSP